VHGAWTLVAFDAGAIIGLNDVDYTVP